MSQDLLINKIEESVEFLKDFERNQQHKDFGDWEERFNQETEKLIGADGKINKQNLHNFRGQQVFVADRPRASLKGFYSSSPAYYTFKGFVNLFIGAQRGGIREALDAFDVLQEKGVLHLLEKYPSPSIGNPLHIHHRGYVFTNRYIRHVYLLSLFLEHLNEEFKGREFTALDIGSSYGIFSSLLKQERPESRHILVDMPGQLILAHYYLGRLFPTAKIAGFKDVGQARDIDKEFIKQYDFILIPTSMFHYLKGHTADLVTNFISLSEMSRHWFDTYIHSNIFQSAPYLFTVNRYDAYPTYSNNITILDYPLKDYEAYFMRTCPFLLYYYPSSKLFWYKKVNYPSQFFQFIGKRLKSKTAPSIANSDRVGAELN